MSGFHKVEKLIKEHDIKFIDLRFSDTIGKEHHVTIPAKAVSEDLFKIGQPFDGSSIEGWKGIECSDMLLRPDAATVKFDPFFDDATLFITCDVVEPSTMESYERCPRGIAKKKNFLKIVVLQIQHTLVQSLNFHFDSVTWGADMSGCHYKINAEEAVWSSDKEFEGGNTGHRPGIKGGYFPLPPMDSHQDLRAAACLSARRIRYPS